MRDSLAHRGPDDAGSYLGPAAALGCRRLSIVDLSPNGHMPMCTPDERYWIVHNGEIFNFLELRAELIGRGVRFRSNTDTEVILHLFALDGPAMLHRLNGMFAFAIWDARERSLFLVRDRLGVKPLYFAASAARLCFASEERALFAIGVDREFDHRHWEELLCFRFVAGSATAHAHVERLLPGHFLTWHAGVTRISRWWRLSDRVRERREAVPDPVPWFREVFDSAVELRRMSDVPVGVLLSGGLDSSSVAASMATQAGEGVASFTMRFAEADYDEGDFARAVVDRWRLAAHELFIQPQDVLDSLECAVALNGAPLAHGSEPHMLAISKVASSHVRVLLSGEGADELLGGYVRYQPLYSTPLAHAARPVLPPLARWLGLDGRIRKLGRLLESGGDRALVLYNACDILPADLLGVGMQSAGTFPYREDVLAEARLLYPRSLVRQAMFTDQHTFLCSVLDRDDRMSMGASIECRTPFLDYRLVEGLAALPTRSLLSFRRSKALLRRAMADRLPQAVLRHAKWGFGVPWSCYLRQVPDLRSLVHDLPQLEPISSGPFDRRKLRSTITRFLAGDRGSEMLVRQLLMIALWYRACVAAASIEGKGVAALS